MTARAADTSRRSVQDRAPESASPPVDPFAAISCPTLQEGARRVMKHWEDVGADALDAHEVTTTLVSLATAAAERRAGSPSRATSGAATLLGRRLLELLRAQVLTATAASANELVAVLRAIEQVREEIDLDWGQYFASRLSGPGGLELLVEVAHDLRSPLTSILFLAETLQRGQSGEVNKVQRRQLGLIYSAALGLSSLASDAIELARDGDRLADKEAAPFSVTELLESVRDIVRPMAEEKGLTIRLLPPTSDRRLGHPLALSRVLLNLTTNALKFTDEGVVELTTHARSLTRLELSVRDTGHGINPKSLSSLYQPFRRSPRGKAGYSFSGTGLGLAICRRLVAAMGSELQVETRPNWGTRFYFELDLPIAAQL